MRPRKFTEKIQWRKLFDLNSLYAVLSDKLAVRDFVTARAGEDVLIPLLWSGGDPANVPLAALGRRTSSSRPVAAAASQHHSCVVVRTSMW